MEIKPNLSGKACSWCDSDKPAACEITVDGWLDHACNEHAAKFFPGAMVKYKTIEDIKTASKAAGSYFFNPGTLDFWKSRISSRIYPVSTGAYFVTSETDINGVDRRYTVRFADRSANISNVGSLHQYRSLSGAHRAAKRFADRANRAEKDCND